MGRLSLNVIVRILMLLKDNGGSMGKYQLYIKSGQSHSNFIKYLDYLRSRGLIDAVVDGDRELIVLTKKGYDITRKIEDILKDGLNLEL